MVDDADAVGDEAVVEAAQILEVDREDAGAVVDLGDDEEVGVGPVVEAVGVDRPVVGVQPAGRGGVAGDRVDDVDLEEAGRAVGRRQRLGLADEVELPGALDVDVDLFPAAVGERLLRVAVAARGVDRDRDPAARARRVRVGGRAAAQVEAAEAGVAVGVGRAAVGSGRKTTISRPTRPAGNCSGPVAQSPPRPQCGVPGA
ncbi:MAG: hypothetical protein H6705_03520 [Myxococcales bacterium]|nr:hypothetical protein [Myxococcales bacterium]